MSTKYALAALALLASTAAFSATLNGGTVSTANPSSELLFGSHTADGGGFIDVYSFTVTGSGIAAAAFLNGAFDLNGDAAGTSFLFSAMVLADASNNALAGANVIDVDGSDGWLVFATLPGPGDYRVLLSGTSPIAADPTQAVAYIGLLNTQINAVPEPETYGLLAMGLLALAGVRRRT